MRIFISSHYTKQLKKLAKKRPQIITKTKEKLAIFQEDSLHPSLKLHKLTGKDGETWSISIEYDLRLTFVYTKEGILLTDIGSHDEVY